ncbi:MAG: GNAT family N-acetyltransferase [Firmicutes bacterium]|nr:GNAT family N-acetyltransferase [Bacillota bacterium]
MRIESKRLIFKKVDRHDAEKLYRIFSNKELTKYFVSGADKNLEQTERRVEKVIYHWEKNKFGDFIVFDKRTLKTIGFGGLHYKIDGGNINISYIVDKEYWRQGFGCEIAQTMIKYGLNTLELKKIVAEIDPNNIPSIKLVEKYGFKYNRNIQYKGFERLEYIMFNSDIS